MQLQCLPACCPKARNGLVNNPPQVMWLEGLIILVVIVLALVVGCTCMHVRCGPVAHTHDPHLRLPVVLGSACAPGTWTAAGM